MCACAAIHQATATTDGGSATAGDEEAGHDDDDHDDDDDDDDDDKSQWSLDLDAVGELPPEDMVQVGQGPAAVTAFHASRPHYVRKRQ